MGNLLNKKVKCADAKRACPLQSRSQQWKLLSCTCSRKLHQKPSAFIAQGSQTCFLQYIKGQLRSLCVLFHSRNSPRVPKTKIKLKWKEVTKGKLLQPIGHSLLKYVTLDQQRNVLLQSVYQGTFDWKNDTRVLCACCKKAYVVFTMQDSSPQPVVHKINWSLGWIHWKICETWGRQKSPSSEGCDLPQRCSPLHWKVLGTCSSKKDCNSLV